MDNRTFSPLEIVPKHQFVPAQSIKVTEILLDATEHRIRTVFSKLRMIVRLTIDTKNLWQQATITYSPDSNFDNIKKRHGLFVLNNMVRYHMCDLPKKDILAKSKFSAKLAGLPRFTTGK
ncbi:1380_t:CDS:1 [Funneliformis geosporum]|nr:1380_t:CDS:1 [Funneliformis geosporum]